MSEFKEFYNTTSWELATKMHDDMLTQSTRRPKEFSIKIWSDRLFTLYFHGCPYRLKDKKIITWIRYCLLNDRSTEADIDEQMDFLTEFVNEQVTNNYWIIEPFGVLKRAFMLCYKNDIDATVAFDFLDSLVYRIQQATQSEKISVYDRANAFQAYLTGLCCLIYYSVLVSSTDPENLKFQNEMLDFLQIKSEDALNEDKQEWGDETDVIPALKAFSDLFPTIEETACDEIVAKSRKLLYTFYSETHRPELAKKYI
ncbi:MAG: hypothetical protein NC453_28100 [Muribaculum sp.]|nr:hypothetical protein [Muribaculum sp.]